MLIHSRQLRFFLLIHKFAFLELFLKIEIQTENREDGGFHGRLDGRHNELDLATCG